MAFRELIYNLSFIAPICALVGVLIGIIFIQRLDRARILLLLYLLIAVLFDLASRSSYFAQNNLILVPLFGLFEWLLLAPFYYQLFRGKSWLWWLPIGLVGLYILFDVIASSAHSPVDFQSYGRVLDCLGLIAFSLIYLWQAIQRDGPRRQSEVTLAAVILLYAAVSALWYLTANFLINSGSEAVYYLWTVITITTPLLYIFITLHLWQIGKTRKR